MKFSIKNKRGFTLVELLVVLAIMGILTTVIFSIFSSTQRFNNSVEKLNTQQSLANDIIYRLRVELADASEVEAFDSTLNAEKMDFTNSDNDGYCYIVQNNNDENGDGMPDGGIMVYGIDDSGNHITTPSYYGNAKNADPAYYSSVKFASDTTGKSSIEVQILNPEDITKPVYKLTSKIDFRTVAASGSGDAIRFKIVN